MTRELVCNLILRALFELLVKFPEDDKLGEEVIDLVHAMGGDPGGLFFGASS